MTHELNHAAIPRPDMHDLPVWHEAKKAFTRTHKSSHYEKTYRQLILKIYQGCSFVVRLTKFDSVSSNWSVDLCKTPTVRRSAWFRTKILSTFVRRHDNVQ